MMTITVNATYEGGVLKPAEPLPLAEHAQVRLTVEDQAVDGVGQERTADAPSAEPGFSAIEQIIARAQALPEDVVASWPTDGASQHDHYIYGTPKRTDLRDKPE
jgi:predicted DNA-binding antitoxin AbrB/MazE fold protein